MILKYTYKRNENDERKFTNRSKYLCCERVIMSYTVFRRILTTLIINGVDNIFFILRVPQISQRQRAHFLCSALSISWDVQYLKISGLYTFAVDSPLQMKEKGSSRECRHYQLIADKDETRGKLFEKERDGNVLSAFFTACISYSSFDYQFNGKNLWCTNSYNHLLIILHFTFNTYSQNQYEIQSNNKPMNISMDFNIK